MPKKPYKFLPGESYKSGLVMKLQIHDDGTVSNVRIIRSTGVRDIDERMVHAVSGWRYKPMAGCGVVDSEITVIVDWE
jgi:TonB family protein